MKIIRRKKRINFKIKEMYLINEHPTFGDDGNVLYRDYEGEVYGRLNGKKIYFKFVTSEKGNSFRIAFLNRPLKRGEEYKELRRTVLIKTYSELHRMLAQWRIEGFFKEEDRKEQERLWKEEQERKAKEIKLGEQISIEKYLLNL